VVQDLKIGIDLLKKMIFNSVTKFLELQKKQCILYGEIATFVVECGLSFFEFGIKMPFFYLIFAFFLVRGAAMK